MSQSNKESLLLNIENFIKKRVKAQQLKVPNKKTKYTVFKGANFQDLRKKSNLLLGQSTQINPILNKTSYVATNLITNSKQSEVLKKYIKRKKIPLYQKQKWRKTFTIINSQGLYENRLEKYRKKELQQLEYGKKVILKTTQFSFAGGKNQSRNSIQNTEIVYRRSKTQTKSEYLELTQQAQHKLIQRKCDYGKEGSKCKKLNQLLNQSLGANSFLNTIHNEQIQQQNEMQSLNKLNNSRIGAKNEPKVTISIQQIQEKLQENGRSKTQNQSNKKFIKRRPLIYNLKKSKNLPSGHDTFSSFKQQKIQPWIQQSDQFQIFGS